MAEATTTIEKKQKDLSTQVLERLNILEKEQGLTFPQGYNPVNELKSFQLELLNIKDRNGKPALEVCTQASIANAMLYMAQLGLRISIKQCYGIVYGNQLTLQRSYFGSEAVAKRVCPYLDQKPWHPNIVYEGEDFEFIADIENGGYKVTKHIPSLDAIDSGKIKFAYLPVKDTTGNVTYTEVMTWKQIEQAWKQSKNNGNNMFQTNFPDQAAIRSIIGRTAKRYLNTANIKDSLVAEALANSVDEFTDPNEIKTVPGYSEEEMARRTELLDLLKLKGIEERNLCALFKVDDVMEIPTEKLEERVNAINEVSNDN